MVDGLYHPSEKSVKTLLEGKSLYLIPPYQRKYTWNKEQWEDIWDDLRNSVASNSSRSNGTHFIGTFVFVVENIAGEEKISVIDGQQRLTTLSLFYLALYRLASEYYYANLRHLPKEDLVNFVLKSNEIYMPIGDIVKLIFKQEDSESGFKNNFEPKLRLSDCSNNNENYIKLCLGTREYIERFKEINNSDDASILWDHAQVGYRGGLIYKGFIYFYDELSKITKEVELPGDNQITADYLNKVLTTLYKYEHALDDWQSILITASNQTDACLLFDSLNNRGVALSRIDIVKNSIFRALLQRNDTDPLSKEKAAILDDAQEDWVELTKRLDESDNILRRFFVDYYNLYCNEPSKKFITESDVIVAYDNLCEKLTPESAKCLYEDLLKKSELYQRIVCPSEAISKNASAKKGDLPREYYYPLLMLKDISGKPAYVLLMYLFDILKLNEQNVDGKSSQNFAEIVMCINRFFTIRHLLDFPKVKHLPALFASILSECKCKNLTKSNEIKGIFYKYLSLDTGEKKYYIKSRTILYDALINLEYDEQVSRKALIKFLFTLYDQEADKRNGSQYYQTYWNPVNGYTIEHILPQGKAFKLVADKDAWTEMIGQNQMSEREKYVHKIGNLLLIDLNKQAGQKPFNDKKIIYEDFKHHPSVGEILAYNVWDYANIESRGQSLAQEFMRLLSDGLLKE